MRISCAASVILMLPRPNVLPPAQGQFLGTPYRFTTTETQEFHESLFSKLEMTLTHLKWLQSLNQWLVSKSAERRPQIQMMMNVTRDTQHTDSVCNMINCACWLYKFPLNWRPVCWWFGDIYLCAPVIQKANVLIILEVNYNFGWFKNQKHFYHNFLTWVVMKRG